MEYKTQVFIPHESDHFRTRLTHTIEVAQISRTLARSLGLNEDLAETVALVHDLGHTPFGHAGEDILNELLKNFGGFNHNRQSLRIVDLLERRYSEHPGLNLSYEVREGIVKHETTMKMNLPEFNPNERPTLEAALVDIADEIAYNAHDIDDGLSSGFILVEDLLSQDFMKVIGHDEPGSFVDEDKFRYAIVRRIIDTTVRNVLEQTGQRIEELKIESLEDVRAYNLRICGYSEEMQKTVLDIKSFLFQRLYRHPELKKHSSHAGDIIKGLFEELIKNSNFLPENFVQRINHEIKELVVADYIAGMTDRFAERVYGELTGKKREIKN